MKKHTIIALLLIGFFVKAQQQELVNNTWYLEKLIVDGTEYFVPDNEEVNNVVFQSTTIDGRLIFQTQVCQMGELRTYEITADNISYEPWFEGNNECQQSGNHEFEQLYLFYVLGLDLLSEYLNIHYEIIEIDGVLQLTIGNANYAIFKNEPLSVIEMKEKEMISIYPNPVKEEIRINGLGNGAYYYQIYSLKGNLIKNGNLNNSNSIDVKDLSKGIYICTISDKKQNIITTHKLLKK